MYTTLVFSITSFVLICCSAVAIAADAPPKPNAGQKQPPAAAAPASTTPASTEATDQVQPLAEQQCRRPRRRRGNAPQEVCDATYDAQQMVVKAKEAVVAYYNNKDDRELALLALEAVNDEIMSIHWIPGNNQSKHNRMKKANGRLKELVKALNQNGFSELTIPYEF